jgi:signal transduction histidine kinase
MSRAMPTPDGADLVALLQGACARLRSAATGDDVLDVTARDAAALAGDAPAWTACVEAGVVASLHGSSDDAAAAAPPAPVVATLLATAQAPERPIARAGGYVAAALEGNAGVEGIVIVQREDGSAANADDPAFDATLTQLASVAGLALAAARWRSRTEAVTRAREALIASVAHDLRNPLNTFAMSAGLLRDDLERNDVDAARALNLVSRMDRATTRMQLFIEDLVEASRIDARRIDLTLREESAAQIVKDAVAAATKAAPEKSATVSADALDEGARVRVDRARMQQLFAKAVAFETKVTGEGGKIVLGVSRDGANVVFTARALGPDGVAVTPPEEGRGGLALMIVRGLTEMQHGSLRVEGSPTLTVAFTFPAVAS